MPKASKNQAASTSDQFGKKREAKANISNLIYKFEELKAKNQLSTYNEAQTRNEFIEPMFEFLGWDMRNLRHAREVITEESVSAGRVDLSFQLQGMPVFFLEAKSIKVNLDEWKWAEQAINYSWNKSVSWAVLCDFEGLKIFNADLPPKNLASNLFLEFGYEEYEDRFEELWLLSKEAFQNQQLNSRAEKWRKSEKRTQVGQKLFEDLMSWRNQLTKQIAKQNDVAFEDLSEGVQTILDRLIFIRTAEDRKIVSPALEPLHRIKPTHFYSELKKLFLDFDKNFNSKLFSHRNCDDWEIESKTLSKIVSGLYDEENGYKYDFSVITADVLGGMYEQYLSYVQNEKSDSTHKSKRKAQGIYYTPKYIVDYLLDESLEKLIGKNSKSKNLKILDPACGSGSFLIAAYDRILEAQNRHSQTSLFDSFEILQRSLYGVDIDEQAVEVAQLNLLLKALVEKTLLPTLQQNVKHGNSLIFGEATELHDIFGAEIYQNKPFNYELEMSEAFANGGFDLVIGNPPYVFARGGSFDSHVKEFYKNNYKVAQYQLNTYALFIERAFQLLKPNGYLSFIVPNTWLTIQAFSGLRKFLLDNTASLKIINIFDKVFSAANVDTCLLIAEKGSGGDVILGQISDGTIEEFGHFSKSEFAAPEYMINIALLSNSGNSKLVAKIDSFGRPLSEFATVKAGLKAYEVGKGNPKQSEKMKNQRVYHASQQVDETYRKYLEGRDVRRYHAQWGGQWIKYGECLAAPRDPDLFLGERILVRQIPSRPPYSINAWLAEGDYLNDINSMIITNFSEMDPKYILGLLNSKLMTFWFINTFDKFQRKTFPQFKVNELATFPIFATSENSRIRVMKVVDMILESYKHLEKASEGSARYNEVLKHLTKLNSDLDQIVYGIVGLNEEEIAIIEGMS
jgi:type I restriction-modification system DNA methylase subunit